eukprot:1379410-Rhodomonas_salina.1
MEQDPLHASTDKICDSFSRGEGRGSYAIEFVGQRANVIGIEVSQTRKISSFFVSGGEQSHRKTAPGPGADESWAIADF